MSEVAVRKENWTEDQVQTIKNTVAIGANDNELKMFLSIAAKYELDPFLHEIWFANMGNRNVIMTGRDGYLKIANRNPNFDGITGDVVHAGDKFVKEGDNVKHAYNIQNRGPIVGAYAIVHRTDRSHPVFVYAPFNEYNKGGRGVWGQYPSAMILKVAESMALKRAFSISGLVTEEELGGGNESRENPAALDAENKRKQFIRQLWNRYFIACGEDARSVMAKVTGKDNSANYTDEDIKNLVEHLARIKNQQTVTQANTNEAEIIEADAIQEENNNNANNTR
ncbi:MAG: recombinase RecT [Synergistaceae bacterium]|nr:recombinase RecT [Synergistaceae bacterium]